MDTTLTIKTNKELRNKAKKVANELGIPLSTVINAMLKQFVREKEIILSARTPNEMTRRAVREALSGKELETFDSFKKWKKEMHSV